VDLATHISKAPWATKEKVVDAFGEKCEHQKEIRYSQVHNQQVGGSTESRKSAKDLQDNGVTRNGASTNYQVHQSQKVIPCRMQSFV
jgi:hypothetical protein